MKEVLLTLIRMKRELNIPLDQCVYLLTLEEGIQGALPDLALRLNTNKFVNSGVIKDEVKSVIYDKPVKIKSLVVRGSYPNLSKQTGDIVKKLAKTFLSQGLSLKERDRIAVYTKNYYAAPFLYMFFNMFPTSGKNNELWEKHFKSEWTGVTLRIMSKGTIKKLERIWRHKDFGLFLIGTYLFIKGCKSEDSGKFFVKSIPHYLEEYEHWYSQAEDRLESGGFDKLMEERNRVIHSTIAI